MNVDELRQDNKIWGTKDINFWAFLSAMLVKMKPKSILEIGAGRSTTFLADSAFENQSLLISIEESEDWMKYISNSLECMCLPNKCIIHMPVNKDGWYDVDEFSLNTRLFNQTFDLVFVDGPSGIAKRAHKEGANRIAHACRNARMVIVDDTHHSSGQYLLDAILSARNYSGKITFDYKQRRWAKKIHEKERDLITTDDNQAVILTDDTLAKTAEEIFTFLK